MSADTPIRIMAVDDHPLIRQGIAGLISVEPDMQLVAEATNGKLDAKDRTHAAMIGLKRGIIQFG